MISWLAKKYENNEIPYWIIDFLYSFKLISFESFMLIVGTKVNKDKKMR